MPRWEREGTPVHVSHMFGDWGPSRAVNPSAGDDPISLGMFSGHGAPVPMPVGPPPPPPEEPVVPPVPSLAEQVAAPPSPAPPPAEPMRNMLLLDDGRVHLNGRYFALNSDHLQTVMQVVMDAYEQTLRDEITTLRLEFNLLPPTTSGPAMQTPDVEAPVVRPVPGEDSPQESEAAGRPTPTQLQQMLLAEAAKRGLPVVQGRKTRTRTSAPAARHVLPRVPPDPAP